MHNLPGKDASVQLASLMSDQSASVFSAHVCQVSFQARPGGRIRRAPCCPLEHLIQQRDVKLTARQIIMKGKSLRWSRQQELCLA